MNTYSVDLADIATANGVGELLSALTGQAVAPAAVKMPDPQNESKGAFFDDKVKANVKQRLSQLWQDPDKAGMAYFESGRRLGDPPR